MKKKFWFFTVMLVWGGGMGGLMGCAARGVQTVTAVQAHGAQTSAVVQDTQKSENPVSLETFSAFLDRG